MFTLASRPQSIGEVLDSSIKLFKQSFAQIWPIALAGAAVRIANIVYVMLHFGAAVKPQQALKMYSAPTFLLLSLASALISLIIYGALLYKTNAVATETDMTTGEAFNNGLRAGPRLFLASLGFGLACAVGFLLLLIPGLYLSIALVLYAAAIVIDDQRAGESLGTSRRLVKGNYWRTTAIFTVAFVILIIVFAALGFVVGIVTVMLSHDPTVILLINSCVQSLAYIVMYPFFAAILIVVYHDLKLRNEGGDLAARVQSLA